MNIRMSLLLCCKNGQLNASKLNHNNVFMVRTLCAALTDLRIKLALIAGILSAVGIFCNLSCLRWHLVRSFLTANDALVSKRDKPTFIQRVPKGEAGLCNKTSSMMQLLSYDNLCATTALLGNVDKLEFAIICRGC